MKKVDGWCTIQCVPASSLLAGELDGRHDRKTFQRTRKNEIWSCEAFPKLLLAHTSIAATKYQWRRMRMTGKWKKKRFIWSVTPCPWRYPHKHDDEDLGVSCQVPVIWYLLNAVFPCRASRNALQMFGKYSRLLPVH